MKSKFTRALTWVMVVGMMSILSVNSQVQAGKTIKLTIGCGWPLQDLPGWEGTVKGFKKIHPNVKLEMQISPWEEYRTKILSQIVAGTPPEIAEMEMDYTPEFIKKRAVIDLSSQLEEEKEFTVDSFFEKIIASFIDKEKIYAVPYDGQCGAAGIYYNKDLFDQAGVSYPTNDWDWNDMLASAKRLTIVDNKGKITQYGYVPSGWGWAYFIYSSGGSLVDDVENPTKGTLNDPKSIRGIQFYVDLIFKYKVTPSPITLTGLGMTQPDLFGTRKVAMFQSMHAPAVESIEWGRWRDMRIGMVIGPKGPTGIRGYPTSPSSFGIPTDTKYPEIAWDFIKFLCGKPGWEYAFEESKKGMIYPPAYKPAFYSEVFAHNPNPEIEGQFIIGESNKYGVISPKHPKWAEIEDRIVKPTIDLILRGEKPAAEALREAAVAITQQFLER